MVDVLVRIAMKDGRVVSRVLRPDAPSFVFHANEVGPAAGGYFRLGVEHILFGIDHLLFVLALVLIVRGVGLLVKTITAFTVAHSITLALATLGVVHLSSIATQIRPSDSGGTRPTPTKRRCRSGGEQDDGAVTDHLVASVILTQA